MRLAERLPVEIIALDSMTLYRGMDIGTAKPTRADREKVPHHLLDLLDPWESASVAWYVDLAAQACQEIMARGRIPFFVGGTPLYLKSLLRGLFDGPPADELLRAQITALAEAEGMESLHRRLEEVDPLAAHRIATNDLRRIVRALEVYQLTGKPISSFQHQFAQPARAPRVLCLTRPRANLYHRINARVLAMLDAGWLDETRRLLPYPLDSASQAVGYQELAAYLRGLQDLPTTITHIQTRTRHFCKHQLTWFRHLPELHTIETLEPNITDDLVEQAASFFTATPSQQTP